jgi:hypothetical protein
MASQQILNEKLEILAGDRGAAGRPQSAVRRDELSGLGSPTLKSAQLTDAPTMDDYNALQADIAALTDKFAQLANIANSG